MLRNKWSVWNIRAYGFFSFLFQNSTTQRTGTCDLFLWIAMPSEMLLNLTFLQEGTLLFHTTSSRLQDRRTSSVLARMSSRNSLTCSELEIQNPSFPFLVQPMSLNIDMKMIRSVNSSGSMFRCCKLCWISWRICNDVNSEQIFHSNPIASPSIPSHSWKKKRHFEFFHLTVPSCICLCITYVTSSPDTVRSPSRTLTFAFGHLDHETMSISSMTKMYFQSYSHSESPRMFLWQLLSDTE